MPPHVPAELKLDSPLYEEDIGDLSPYVALPLSTSSRTSSTTINTSHSAWSTFTRSEVDSGTPFSAIPSPQVAHSQALATKPPRKFQTEISALTMDSDTLAKMRRWILGIAVVEFDVDTGPTVDGVYPPLNLEPAELETLAFCALPDSLQFDQGSQTHSFRLRERPSSFLPKDKSCSKDGFMYGFSHFIQKKDSTSKRGYQQRSLVVLTQHQFPALFYGVIGLFGPLFEAHGTPMLEAACHNIATWPDSEPGRTVELGFLGSVLHVEIPRSIDVQQVAETPSFNEKYDPTIHILASTTPFVPPPILLFEGALTNLWSIWECLVLCEPILVFGVSPAQTSQAIWWLRDLMRPIPLAGDIRPYFTMQDSDSSQLVNKLPPKAGLMLGVTNPFFEKSCVHWPHVLSLGRRDPKTRSTGFSKQNSPTSNAPAGPPPGWKTATHRRYISKDRDLLKKLEIALRGDTRARIEASLALRRHFCSRSTQLIAPLARYLNSLIPSPTEVQRVRQALGYPSSPLPLLSPSHAILSSASPAVSTTSRSSLVLSYSPSPSLHAFPVSPGVVDSPLSASTSTGLTPTQGQRYSEVSTLSRPSSALRLKPFNNANFFASLKAHGSVLPFRSSTKRTEFYERWLKSPAFGAWLAQQEQIVQSVLNPTSATPSPEK